MPARLFSTMLDVFIIESTPYTGRQYARINSFHSKVYKSQHNLDAFETQFLVFKAFLDRQNSTRQSLSSTSTLLTPLLDFFGIFEN